MKRKGKGASQGARPGEGARKAGERMARNQRRKKDGTRDRGQEGEGRGRQLRDRMARKRSPGLKTFRRIARYFNVDIVRL